MTPYEDIETLLEHAHNLADVMGSVSSSYFYCPIEAETKSDKTFVTKADRETEQAARRYLTQSCPRAKVWGEEFGKDFAAPAANDITWVFDPIDGTKAFMDGLAYWTNLIAAFRGTELLLGVINQPITGERYWGGPAIGSRYKYVNPANGQKTEEAIHCARVKNIEKLMWRSTTRDYMQPRERKAYNALAERVEPRDGGDAMLFAALARGRTLNCVYDAELSPWDVAGPAAVLLGAGATVSDGEGNPLNYFFEGKTTMLTCATKELHAAVLAVLRTGS